MTLSGVLKDILLVMASMAIFGDPVSGLQVFGYTIAICGLCWYKLGPDVIKEYIGHGQRSWADFGARRPALRRLVIFGLSLVTIFILLGGVSLSGAVPDSMNPAKVGQSFLRKAVDKTGGFGGVVDKSGLGGS